MVFGWCEGGRENSVINKMVIEDPFQCKLVEQKSSSTLSVFYYRNKEKETILQKVSLHSFHSNQVIHRDRLGEDKNWRRPYIGRSAIDALSMLVVREVANNHKSVELRLKNHSTGTFSQ